MEFPSGCHHAPTKRNIFQKAWKKCADSLAVWNFCVNTHTHTYILTKEKLAKIAKVCLSHTHTHTQSPRASIYGILSKFQSISRTFLIGLSCLSSQVSYDKHHTSPITIAATERGLCASRRYAVHGYAMSVCRRNCLYANSMSNPIVKPDYI